VMSEDLTLNAYATSPGARTIRFERILPGPAERVWRYLTDSEMRGQWLATGPMELFVGGEVALTWRNNELTGVREEAPARFAKEEHRMTGRVTRCDPPRLLAFTWSDRADPSEVTFELTPQGADTRLVVTHRRLPDRGEMVGVSAGWHAHLAVLEDRMAGRAPGGFWSLWSGFRDEYDRRLPQD